MTSFAPHLMAQERPGFVNVDELVSRISLEQAATYYGIPLPALHRTGQETRTRCFLNCGREGETGDRSLAIQEGHPATQWRCHHYGCGRGGNLVSRCDLMKGGADAGGRPRGDRFKEIAADLRAMVEGVVAPAGRAAVPSSSPAPPAPPRINAPLRDSENERARALVDLDVRFVRDVANLPPAASRYFRLRPHLSPETCRQWRVGYLPRDTGGDHAGGTMRGKVVYAYHSAEGDLLTWFGRDPDFETKHQQWDAAGRTDKEPEKFHFVKGFHRGLELFGQERLRDPDVTEKTKGLGLVLVEGPNDVIRLSSLGVPAVGLCSNTISREQAAKAAALARSRAGGVVTVFLDCDPEGEKGMMQALGYLSQLVPVRLAWTSRMYGGRFRGRQPESLTPEELAEIRDYLADGEARGWSL